MVSNECECCGSKFGFEENSFDTSRAGRDFHTVADRRRCHEFDFVGRQNSPDRGDGSVLGTLSDRGIFCVVLRDRLRAVAASACTAEGDVGANARSLSAVVAPAAGK